MEQITGIAHLGLRVRDLGTARDFYAKLGFEFIIGPIGPEPVAVMLHPSGVNINFILNASADASEENILMDVSEKHTGLTHFALQVTDLEKAKRHVEKFGITITETIDTPFATFFFVRDPDGNVVELNQSKTS